MITYKHSHITFTIECNIFILRLFNTSHCVYDHKRSNHPYAKVFGHAEADMLISLSGKSK